MSRPSPERRFQARQAARATAIPAPAHLSSAEERARFLAATNPPHRVEWLNAAGGRALRDAAITVRLTKQVGQGLLTIRVDATEVGAFLPTARS